MSEEHKKQKYLVAIEDTDDASHTWITEYVELLQSQLDAQSAHIEELNGYLLKIKPVLQTIAVDRGKDSKADKLFNELQDLLNQTHAESLAQVKRGALFDLINNCNCTAEDDDGDPMLYVSDIISYINKNYANNLEEKG